MAQIYYDPTGGFLYGIDSNGNPEIVKTDACVMMPENVFVDNIGKIHVKDLQGLDTCISDGQGNDAIIMGPIGPQGPEGPQGPQGQAVGISTIIPNTNNVTVVFTDGEQIVVNHGKDGTSIKLISSLSELPYTGKIGDSCLLVNRDYDQTQGYVDAGSLYEYNGNAWGLKGNIKGPKGDQGPQGPQGTPVTITKINSSDPSKTLVTFSDGQSMTVYNGTDGADGTSVTITSNTTDRRTGITAITFSDNQIIYLQNGTRFLVPDSTVTDAVLLSSVVPAFNSLVLQHGDYTISYDTQSLWYWDEDGGGFAKLFTLKGDQGPIGPAGPAGQNGADGQDGADGEGIHVLLESDIALLAQHINVTRDAVCQTLIDNIIQAEQIVSAGLYQFITNDYAYPETDPFILDGWLFKVVSTDGVSYVTHYTGQSLIGPQGAKGDQGDSYFTQPVADKLTAIAGEYDSVKNEANDCTEKILELENRIAVLEGYITQLNSIDLSGLAVAYPKDVTPEEA